MICKKCGHDNPDEARFCATCGTPLATPLTPGVGSSSQQTKELQDAVRRLEELIVVMNGRLAALERRQGIKAPIPEPTPAEVPEAAPITAEEITPAAPIPPPPPRKPREWEQILGGNWLARIGVLFLIIGAGFFLKFAFDQNWLDPTARVILGIIAGLGMLGGGYYWRKRYLTFSQTLSGGGIAVLYLAIFAAFAFFQMLTLYVAIGLLFVISGGSAALALRYNSMALAIIGILGAFIAPFILGTVELGRAGVSVAGMDIQLLVYIMVVDLGVLALSTFRNWRWLTLLAFFGSLLAFSGWYDQFGDRASLLVSEGSLTILFLIFVGATALYHLIWRRPAQGFDYTLMFTNAAAYLGASCALMWTDLRAWMGGFTLLLALFYGSLAYVALHRGAQRLCFFAVGIAIALLTIAIPIQLGDRAWTTIAWAIQGTVLMSLAIKFRMSQFRYYSYALFAVVAIRLLFLDTGVNLHTFQPVVNERVLAFLFAIAAMYLTGYLLWRERKTIRKRLTAVSTFWVAANFFTLWVLSFEVWDCFGSQLSAANIQATRTTLENVQNLSLTGLWAFYAMLLLVIGIAKRWRLVRLWALGLLIVPIAKVFIYDVWALETLYRIIAFVGLGLLFITGAYLYQRYGQAIRGFIVNK